MAYHRANNFTRLDIDIHIIPNSQSSLDPDSFLLIILPGQLALMDMIYQAYSNILLNNKHNLTDFNIKMVQQMPYFASANVLDILEIFGTFLYPIALTLQLPIYISIIVWEKEEKLREMMKGQGMKMWTYWITNYIFDITLYAAVILFFWVSGAIVGIRFFTQTDPFVLIIFFFGWGNALISLGFFCSSFLNSKRASIVVGYVIALIGSLIGIVWCVGIYGNFAFSLGQTLPKGMLLWPQFAFIRGIYLMNNACAESFTCYGPVTSWGWEDELTKVIFFLYLDAFMFLIVGLYLDAVLPREFGIRKHPLFFLKPLANKLFPSRFDSKKELKKTNLKEEEQEDDISEEESPLLQGSSMMIEDVDVKIERERVEYGNYPEGSPLVVRNLRKVFNSKGKDKIAVKGLYLVLESGELFGLLGENGAGKTTSINMLTGLFPPTSGNAWVGGYSIVDEIDKVHLVMGVCP